MSKICIVSPRHISYNPRVLKEADALSAAGYDVAVVCINNDERLAAFDQELMRVRNWKLRTVRFDRAKEKGYWLYLSVKQRFFQMIAKIGLRGHVAERAAEKAFDGLRRLAKAERADLYIAHHVEALGAAYSAAKENGSKFGFDAEDFHTGMSETGSPPDKGIEWLERKYLPLCDHLTAASKGIAEAYRDKYGIPLPRVVLNVFPFEDLPARSPGNPVKFYWYSQVIGPNRGIELLLDAASRITEPFEIHLRGKLYSEAYRNALELRCEKSGLWDRIILHEPIQPAELIREGNRFDVGLALESNISVNRNICVTNKVFSYLMSRLYLIGTDTYGQKDIFSHFRDAVRVCRIDDPEDLADAMRSCIHGEIPVEEGKKAAERAVKESFNWELESAKLCQLVSNILTS